MTYRVVVTAEAEQNVAAIYAWIAKRSPDGANRWYRAYLDALGKLEHNAQRKAIAVEGVERDELLWQLFFRTRRGHRYRLIFTIIGDDVRVLYVRGYGQDDIT